MEKIILAYSGGLDTSIITTWLSENYKMDVIAVCVDVGQDDDMEEIKKKAISSGAVKAYALDVRNEFIEEYAYKGLKALAVYEESYLLGTALARPLIAKKLVEIAHKENADYICHGCTGKGNDQVRFEVGIASIDPTIKIIAPWREWDIKSREDAIDYAEKHNIKLEVTKEKIYSRDHNLWHISHEGGHIEELDQEHKAEELYMMTNTLEQAPDEAEYVRIAFVKGTPTKLNDVAMNGETLVSELNKIAGKHGVGVIDIVENRIVGMKSRGIYETPAGTVLMKALIELESICLDKPSLAQKKEISQKYGELVYGGLWFTPIRMAYDAFIDSLHETCTGDIVLKLYKGNVIVASRDSAYSLYNEEISSFGDSELYDHKDAEGFIKLYSLSSKIINNKDSKW